MKITYGKVLPAVLLTSTLAVGACASSGDVDDLKARVNTLQRDVAALKTDTAAARLRVPPRLRKRPGRPLPRHSKPPRRRRPRQMPPMPPRRSRIGCSRSRSANSAPSILRLGTGAPDPQSR